jgi:hypothetical protein
MSRSTLSHWQRQHAARRIPSDCLAARQRASRAVKGLGELLASESLAGRRLRYPLPHSPPAYPTALPHSPPAYHTALPHSPPSYPTARCPCQHPSAQTSVGAPSESAPLSACGPLVPPAAGYSRAVSPSAEYPLPVVGHEKLGPRVQRRYIRVGTLGAQAAAVSTSE